MKKDNVNKSLWVLFIILTIINVYVWSTTGLTWNEDIKIFNYWLIPTMLAQLEVIYMLVLKNSTEEWIVCKAMSFLGTAMLQIVTMGLSIINFTIFLWAILGIAVLGLFIKGNYELARIMRKEK